MPLDEFWYGPIENLEAYRKAYYMDLHNTGHVNGMYVGRAVAACLSKDAEYPKVNMYEASLKTDTNKSIKGESLKEELKKSYSIKERFLQKRKNQQMKRGD